MKYCIDQDNSHVYRGELSRAYENGAIVVIKDKIKSFTERIPQHKFERRIAKLREKGIEHVIIKQKWQLF